MKSSHRIEGFSSFWSFGVDDDVPESSYRWTARFADPAPICTVLMKGCGEILNPPQITCIFETTSPIEDFPNIAPFVQICSKCGRDFIIRNCPGNAQFIPVSAVDKNGLPMENELFAINWLYRIDAVDMQRSLVYDRGGKNTLVNTVIDANKVPSSVVIFRVLQEYGTIFCRNSFRKQYSNSKLSGLIFM